MRRRFCANILSPDNLVFFGTRYLKVSWMCGLMPCRSATA